VISTAASEWQNCKLPQRRKKHFLGFLITLTFGRGVVVDVAVVAVARLLSRRAVGGCEKKSPPLLSIFALGLAPLLLRSRSLGRTLVPSPAGMGRVWATDGVGEGGASACGGGWTRKSNFQST